MKYQPSNLLTGFSKSHCTGHCLISMHWKLEESLEIKIVGTNFMDLFNLFKFHFNNKIFNNSKEERILGVAITSKLTFPNHIIDLKSLLRSCLPYIKYMIIQINFKSRIPAQLHYCPQVWMFRPRATKKRFMKNHRG